LKSGAPRILLISYHFPPSAAVGGQRMANFAASLVSLGWNPYVLTIQDKDIEQVDAERLADVRGVHIHKAAVLPTAAGILSFLVVWLRKLRSGRSRQPSASKPAASWHPSAATRETLVRRMRRYLFSFLLLPDFERGWICPAILAAIRVVRRHRIGWIVTSCPPYSVHLIGLAVKLLAGTRWVADFRDPWMTTGSKRLYPTCALSIRIESWLERKVMEKADLVVFNVERLRNAYRARYVDVAADKFVFIPNGIRARATGTIPKYDTFTLSYTGALYVGRSPEPVFQALSRLIQKGTVAPQGVRIKLVGQCRTINGTPTSAVIRKYGLESVVDVQDSVPRNEALEIVRRSHLALLFAPNLPFQIPAKVYDYLGAGTRILAIAEDGGTADLVRDTDAGRTFSAEDVEGITAFIHDEMISRRSMNGSHAASLLRFDLRNITEELVGHLDRIAAATETGRAQ